MIGDLIRSRRSTLVVALGLVLAASSAARAHDAERTRVSLTFERDGSFVLDVANDPDWLLLRLEPFADVVPTGGDLFWRHTLPNMIDASTKPWIDTLNTLATNEAGYTFVPGHGDVGNAQDVAAFRDYLATLQKLVADAHAQGRSGNALVESVMPTLTELELSGRKKIPQAQRSK